MQNWFFFENPNFKKVNLIKRAHLKKDCQLFLIKCIEAILNTMISYIRCMYM